MRFSVTQGLVIMTAAFALLVLGFTQHKPSRVPVPPITAGVPAPGFEDVDEKEVIVPTEEDEAIDTSNWQTYRNEELGFEVKYPEDIFMVSDDGTVNILESKEISDFSGSKVSVSATPFNNSPYDVAQDSVINAAPYLQAQRLENVIIDGKVLPVVQMSYEGISRSYYFFGVRLVFNYDPDDDERWKVIENQILSTFRFVDVVSNNDGILVPRNYKECTKWNKNYVRIYDDSIYASERKCVYSVSYSTKNENDIDKFSECEKRGGATSNLHGDPTYPIPENFELVYIYYCELHFINPAR